MYQWPLKSTCSLLPEYGTCTPYFLNALFKSFLSILEQSCCFNFLRRSNHCIFVLVCHWGFSSSVGRSRNHRKRIYIFVDEVEVNGEEQYIERKKVQEGKNSFFHKNWIWSAKIIPLLLLQNNTNSQFKNRAEVRTGRT